MPLAFYVDLVSIEVSVCFYFLFLIYVYLFFLLDLCCERHLFSSKRHSLANSSYSSLGKLDLIDQSAFMDT